MVKFDRHARRRMKWRNITESEVMFVLDNPDRTEDTDKGRKNAYRIVKDQCIKVTFRTTDEEILVISAMRKKIGG